MPLGTWRLFGVLTLGALALGAQEIPPSPPSSTFGGSVDVRVVNVEVVVTGAKRERVRGLSARDLVLKVDGEEVPIEYFAEMEGGKAESPAPSSSPSESSAPPAAASLAPEGRSLLVFIDDLFAVAKQRDVVLAALAKDLKLLQPEDRMAIVAFYGGRLDVLSGWTGDRRALAAALQEAQKRPALGNDVLAARRSDEDDEELVEQALASSDPDGGGARDVYGGARAFSPLVPSAGSIGEPRFDSRLAKISRAVVAAMQGMAPPSGRRTLLLLSGGWPAPSSHLPLAVAANRLGYTVYPVDVQGIDTAFVVNDASRNYSKTDGFISSGWKRASQDGMEFLARITGGKAILNSARLTALGRVVEDTSSYYWLGFTPKWKGDDRHHRIEVKARQRGLKVRSRRGFSDFSRATEAAMTAQEVLLLGGDAKDRRLTVETGPLATKGLRRELPVTIAIPVADLTPIEQGGHWTVEATLAAGVMDITGSFSSLAEIPFRLDLPEKPAPDTLTRYHTTLKLRRGSQRLVLTVRDPLGGRTLWGEAEVGP